LFKARHGARGALRLKNRNQQIKTVSYIGIFGNLILALVKIAAGTLSGSIAVVSDGVDSTTDIVTSLVILFTAKIISQPPDREHPYGHHRAEAIATKILSFVIFFAGAQLALSTILRIIENQAYPIPSLLAIYVTAISIAGKLILTFYHFAIGKKIESSMLIANGKNMQNDIIISIGVLIGLLFTNILKISLIDSITAFIVSLWIMKTAFEIFLETSNELMDGIEDPSVYNKIFNALCTVDGAFNPHRTRVRKLANMYIIDLDVEVRGSLTVAQAHEIAKKIELVIKESIENVYDIMVHVEPLGNIEKQEKYGLSRND